MKLSNAEFKKMKDLQTKLKSGEITADEKKELAQLMAKKASGNDARNDPAWWTKYGLIKDAANVAFNTIKGTPLYLKNFSPETVNNEELANVAILNGIRIDYFRYFGNCSSAEDSFSYQARQLWLAMHRKYRGMGGYEWADLGIIISCICEVFADIARAERIYGCLNYFNVRNRTVPDQLLAALRFRKSDVNGSRIADFRYQLNRLILKAKNLCLPGKGISILHSFMTLESNVFKDSENDRSTWIIYDTPYRAIYDPIRLSSGGCKRYIARTNTSGEYTFQSIIADLENSLNNLLNDTDVARVCSDVLACFGDSVFTLSELPEDYIVKPVKDDNRLLQFHNTTIVGDVTGSLSKNVIDDFTEKAIEITDLEGLLMYQENNVIKQDLYLSNNGHRYWNKNSSALDALSIPGFDVTQGAHQLPECLMEQTLLDIWKENPNTDDVIEMTRQICTITRSDFNEEGSSISDVIASYHVYAGNIVCMKIGMFVMQRDKMTGHNTGLEIKSQVVVINEDDGAFANYNKTKAIVELNQADWHPLIFVKYKGEDYTSDEYLMYWDIDNYVPISVLTIRRLHEVAILSGTKFDLPGLTMKD